MSVLHLEAIEEYSQRQTSRIALIGVRDMQVEGQVPAEPSLY